MSLAKKSMISLAAALITSGFLAPSFASGSLSYESIGVTYTGGTDTGGGGDGSYNVLLALESIVLSVL